MIALLPLVAALQSGFRSGVVRPDSFSRRGGDVTIVHNRLTRTYPGNGRTFTILGDHNRITITGSARRVVINGNRNTLHADQIGSLSIPGNRNNVHYNHGVGADAANVSLLGNDNRVRRP